MTIYERGTPFSIVGRSVFSTNADPNTPTHMILWLSYSEVHSFSNLSSSTGRSFGNEIKEHTDYLTVIRPTQQWKKHVVNYDKLQNKAVKHSKLTHYNWLNTRVLWQESRNRRPKRRSLKLSQKLYWSTEHLRMNVCNVAAKNGLLLEPKSTASSPFFFANSSSVISRSS